MRLIILWHLISKIQTSKWSKQKRFSREKYHSDQKCFHIGTYWTTCQHRNICDRSISANIDLIFRSVFSHQVHIEVLFYKILIYNCTWNVNKLARRLCFQPAPGANVSLIGQWAAADKICRGHFSAGRNRQSTGPVETKSLLLSSSVWSQGPRKHFKCYFCHSYNCKLNTLCKRRRLDMHSNGY